jgi:hypothetical protein
MNDPTIQTVPLDEQVWREWVHKGKLREQRRARRRRKIAVSLVVLALIAFGIFYLRTTT